jgi:hypothetical protein
MGPLLQHFLQSSAVESHHFDAAPGKNFDAAAAPTLQYIK